MKNIYFLLAFLASVPLEVLACGGGRSGGFAWINIFIWIFALGIIFGILGFIYGILLYIVRYFSKDKNKKVFENKKNFIVWSPILLIISLLAWVLLEASTHMLCGTTTSF